MLSPNARILVTPRRGGMIVVVVGPAGLLHVSVSKAAVASPVATTGDTPWERV
ncbi:MAG TPA: hypothetical protein VNU19_15525 [Candidatus Acidoferrum sp.]|nr:hypothetical protein [Candidatus Acidoferrum sp.]